MNLIKFSYHLFCKNLTMNIIIILQLIACLFLVNDVIITANNYYTTVNEYRNSGLSNITGIIVDCDGELIPENILSELPNNSIKYCELSYSGNISGYHFVSYGKNFVSDYTPKISQGKWLDELDEYGKNNLNTIPVVLPYTIKNVNIGDKISINNKITVEIIGIMENPYYCNFLGGSGLNTNYVMKNAYEVIYPTLITLSDYLEDFLYEDLSPLISEAVILKDQKYELQAYSSLNSHYLCSTFTDVLHRGENEAFGQVRALSPFIIFLLLVAITGMIGCISINTLKNLNFYSILYINGASARKCVIISLLYTSIYVFISFVLYLGVFLLFQKSMCLYNLIAIVIIITLLLSLSLIPYRILKKHPAVEIFNNTK